MKLAVNKEYSVVEGCGRSSAFTIKSSAKAFKIISSGIYSNKIKAVIRELSTNAYDSQVQNGNADEPFLVHLPTYLKPKFSVRDYGVGLTLEELGLIEGIPGIYNTYFDSNKTHSNDFTGCLGLGSKSPFSYADSFLVESFKDGKKFTCSAHLNEHGEPTITLMETTDTDEPNGVCVTVAVESNDCYSFVNNAREVYKYFPVTPKFTGTTCHIEPSVEIMKGKNWRLLKGGDDTVIIMGNVAYPVSTDNGMFTEEEKNILTCPFEIRCDIGELEFDAGRESLGYDKRTVAVLKRICKEIREEIKDSFKDVYKDCKNLWEARQRYIYVYTGLHSIVGMLDLSLEYEGKPVFKSTWDTNVHISAGGVTMLKFHKYPHSGRVYRSEERAVQFNNKPFIYEFYENDLKIGAISRCRSYCLDNPNVAIIMVKFDTQAAKDKFMEELGIDATYFKKTSDLPKVSRMGGRSSTGQSLEKVCKFTGGFHDNSTQCWESVQHDIDAGGIYVELCRGKMNVRKGDDVVRTIHGKELSNVAEVFNRLNDPIDIFGIKTVLMEKVKEDDEWSNFMDVVKEFLEDNPELESNFITYKTYDGLDYQQTDVVDFIVKRLKDVKDDDISKVCQLVKEAKAITDRECEDFNTLYEFVYGKRYEIKNDKNELEKTQKAVIVKYPLLQYCSRAETPKSAQPFVDYVENFIEKGNS